MASLDPILACCCLPALPPVPAEIWNRPGLPRIALRIGRFGSFRLTLLDRIAREPALAALTTRESDDHAVSVIEMFAAIADILGFYNETVANEFYLRTARERDSVLRLTRLIGYELNPGLAATALIAFSLDDGARTRLRQGLKVMSIPGQDERAQTYETLAETFADARLNALPIAAPPVVVNAFAAGADGGPVLSRPALLSVGDALLLFGDGWLEEKSLAAITATPVGERLRFAPGVQAATLSHPTARLTRALRRLRFFGASAPDHYQIYDTNPAIPAVQRWQTKTINASFAAAQTSYPLDARYEDLRAGAQLMIDRGPGGGPRILTAMVTATAEAPQTLGTLADTVSLVTLRQTTRGAPALAMTSGGIAIAARTGAGNPIVFTPNGWVPFDFAASSDPALIRTAAARLDLFVRDRRFGLQHAVWNAGAWGSPVALGGVLTSAPVALALPGGEAIVFARGLDLGLWFQEVLPTPGAWTPLGGLLGSAPAAVSGAAGRLDVFVRGVDRALWHKARAGGLWSDWLPLEGVLGSAPAAAAPAPARVDVVALDDAGALLHRRFDGAVWTAWANLGGVGQGVPAIVATGADRVEILVRGRDGTLRHIARAGAVWSAWVPLGGGLTSDPAVVLGAGGAIEIAARDGDGALARRTRNGAVWSAWSHLEAGLGAINDRRRARIWEIGRDDIVFADIDYADTITDGRVAAKFDGPPPAELAKGRRILIASGSTRHAATITAASPAPRDFGAAPDHVLIDFAPALDSPLTGARLIGNVAEASHGETQRDEVLGNGDATRAFQRFRLAHAPVTQLANKSSLTATAALELRVGGELWREVPSLFARGSTERIYTARRDDAGNTWLTTGDGRTGARLPTGAGNLVARYRKGVGLEGRVRADQLAIPLERPVGLRSVTNPLPSDGGAEPQTRDDARASAPTTVRTFGRAVSLDDFAWIAVGSGRVARAEGSWVWDRLERAVFLSVAGAEGAKLSPTALADLYTAFSGARDPNRSLFLANLVRVPITVSARIVRDPALEADAVLAAARAALMAAFAFKAMPLGKAVHASDIYAAIQSATGVVAVDLDLFHLLGHAGLTPVERAARAVTAAAVQDHIRIFPARPTPKNPAQIDRFARAGFDGPPPPVLAAEQAYVADPARDIALTLVEAL